MTETLKYSLIGREDIAIGTGTFEATLADGRVVTLHALDVAHWLGDAYTYAQMLALPDPEAGQIVRVTDNSRGLWMYTGTQWVALSGGVINVVEFGADPTGVTDSTTAIQDAITAADATVDAEKVILWPAGTYNVTQISFKGTDNVTNIALGSVVIIGTDGAGTSIIDINGGTSGADADRTSGIEFRGRFIVNATGTYQMAVDISSMINSRIQLSASGAFSLATVRINYSWDNAFHLVALSNTTAGSHVLMLGSSATASDSVNANVFRLRLSGTGSANTQVGLYAGSGKANIFSGDISAVGTGVILGSCDGNVFEAMYFESVLVCVSAHPSTAAHISKGTAFIGGYYQVLTNGTAFRLGSTGGSQFTSIISAHIVGVSGGSSRTAFDWGTTAYAVTVIDPLLEDIDTIETGTWRGATGFTATTKFAVLQADWVSFNPTQRASTDVNTLDDYEEGSWTPVLTFATPGDLVATLSVAFGRYTKIGDLVTLHGHVLTSTFTHTTASGSLQITGLPFTSTSSTSSNTFSGSARWGGITKAGYTQVSPVVENSTAVLTFEASGSAVAISAVDAADMPTGGTVRLKFSIVYKAA